MILMAGVEQLSRKTLWQVFSEIFTLYRRAHKYDIVKVAIAAQVERDHRACC
jgi:hypothetical protein